MVKQCTFVTSWRKQQKKVIAEIFCSTCIYTHVWLDVYMYVVFQRENWKIEFLDTLVYKDHNNRLQATFNKKQTDHQNYPHAKTAHALSLKKSIAYSQALRIKRVNTFKTCSTFDEYKNHSN